MSLEILHDKSIIEQFLQKQAGIQIYSIGDLDDFFWPKTIWFSLKEGAKIKAIALLYVGMSTPTLLLFYKDKADYSLKLIELMKASLPKRFNAHLSAGLLDAFGKAHVAEYYGLHYKMLLTQKAPLIQDKNIRKLHSDDLPTIETFLKTAYPHNWFDSRMLETEKYFGYFLDATLVGIAGIHVYSEIYKVAALGNIATHPNFRGQQIAYKLTATLCFELQKTVDFIGLNVHSDNEHAIKCYQKIGFELIGEYDECLLSF